MATRSRRHTCMITAGNFLFEALWPLEVSLREGAIRGDAAVGVGTGAFDIPEIVRMTFRESG